MFTKNQKYLAPFNDTIQILEVKDGLVRYGSNKYHKHFAISKQDFYNQIRWGFFRPLFNYCAKCGDKTELSEEEFTYKSKGGIKKTYCCLTCQMDNIQN